MRKVVRRNELRGLLLAYSISLDCIFYLAAAISVISFFFSCFMGWTDLRRNNNGEKTNQKI